MSAVLGELPPAGEDGQWAFEMKWDGVRAVAYAQAGSTRLMSRNDLDVSVSYPEVLGLAEALPGRDVVLDGELVTFDPRGRPSFELLQERMHVRDPAAARRLAGRVPVVYLVFDVLVVDGRALSEVPYVQRRQLLEDLGLQGTAWRTPPWFPGPGADVLAASAEHGLEGVLAKRRASLYRPGRRSPDWRKVKHVRMQEVVLAGWRPGQGRRAGGLGSLILGVYDDAGGLRFAGGVGTGFTDRMLAGLAARLAPLEQVGSPFAHELPRAETRDARWVRPVLVGEVQFAEWTSDGRLRHPSWRGLRPDKSAFDVRRSDPTAR